jgi:hypothetical protein
MRVWFWCRTQHDKKRGLIFRGRAFSLDVELRHIGGKARKNGKG